MSIWICFFFMIFANFFYGTLIYDNLPYFFREKWNLLPFFLFMMIISTFMEYIVVRNYPGSEIEAFSTAFISCGTALLLFWYVSFMKEYDRLNGHSHYD